MVILYIRHAKDREGNYLHDEKLTKEGKYEAFDLTKNLIEEYGLPDIIYYSPFYRVRQTRKVMMKVISKYKKENNIKKEVVLILEPRLGRFFTRNQSKYPDVRESTFRKGAIIEERSREFKERVEEQLNQIQNIDKNIWNITHSLVILHVARLSDINRSSHVNYLDVCVVKK